MRSKTLTFFVCFATAFLLNVQLSDAQDLTKFLTRGGEVTPEAQKALRGSQEFKTLTPEQIEARLKEFVADPDGFMEAHSKKSFGELSKIEIDPLRGELATSRADSAIQQFMRDHPELGKEGERKMGAILDAYPHLTKVEKNASADTIRLKLEDALGRLIAQDPAGYAASKEALKQGGDQNIEKAKAGASGLGNKKGSIAQTSESGRDEFDKVLDLNNASQARFAGQG